MCVCVHVCVCVSVWVDNNLPFKALPLSQQNQQDEGDQREDGLLCCRPLEMTSEIKTHWWTTHRYLHCRQTWELRTERGEGRDGGRQTEGKTHRTIYWLILTSPALQLGITKSLVSEVLCLEPQNMCLEKPSSNTMMKCCPKIWTVSFTEKIGEQILKRCLESN